MNKIILFIVFSIFISSQIIGCSKHFDGNFKIPFVYRIDIQQGNVIEQSMIDKLERGMSKEKVRFIMGTPLLRDPFHSNRWEYVYSVEPGEGVRSQRHVTIFFKDNKLARLEGSITPIYKSSHGVGDEDDAEAVTNIILTEEREKKGLFSGWFDFGN